MIQPPLVLELGTVEYGEALGLQRELVRMRQEGHIPDTLVLLEHPPVITLGKNADRSNLLVADEELARRGVALHQIERGGDITFHGPGQLVGYTVFGLGNRARAKSEIRSQRPETRSADDRERALGSGLIGVRKFVEGVEQALVFALAELGVEAATRRGYIGVWIEERSGRVVEWSSGQVKELAETEGGSRQAGLSKWRKAASIGIAVRRGVTMHGFALNVTTDLSWFRLMNPCGLEQAVMTSVEDEGGKTDARLVREATVRGFERVFGLSFQRNLPRSLTSLTNGLSASAISSASLRE